MGKLDELKKIVADQFEKADATTKTKEYIESFGKMNQLIDDIQKENKALVDSNAELSKNYVELVKTGAGTSSVPPKAMEGEGEPPSFEKMLAEFQKESK